MKKPLLAGLLVPCLLFGGILATLPGVVLCIAPGGHVCFEAPGVPCCADEEAAIAGAGADAEGACGTCTDYTLARGTAAAGRTQDFRPGVRLAQLPAEFQAPASLATGLLIAMASCRGLSTLRYDSTPPQDSPLRC